MKKYLFASLFIWVLTACEKEKTNVDNTDAVSTSITNGSSGLESTNSQTVPGGVGSECNVSGNFVGNIVGTSPANNGITAPVFYQFMENNFLRGASTTSNPFSTWGGYRVTCDSVIWMNYNPANAGYYINKGKFSTNRTIISGTWLNQNNATVDYGNFTITKQ